MKKIILLTFAFILLFTINSKAQDKSSKKELTGIIKDYNDKPIKGVRIFVDSLKTKVKTDKKGVYKILVSDKNKLITAFSSKHGLIDIDYTGQDKINFIFPKETLAISKKEFESLGYGISPYSDNNPDYSSYTDIFQLLKTKFQSVQVVEDRVTIRGAGRNLSGNSYPPLFLVNGTQVSNISNISPADIKSISVERTTSSIHGTRAGGGGVIKIKLK